MAAVASAAEVKINFDLECYLKFIEQHPLLNKRPESQEQGCDACEETARWYCVEDEAALCDEHRDQTHLLPMQKTHNICPIADKLKQKHAKPPQCTKHHSPMLLWCEGCHILCCETCASRGAHKGHSALLVEDVVSTIRRKMEQRLKTTGAAAPTLEAEVQRLLKIDESLQEDAVRGAAALDETYQRLIADLTREKQELHQ